MTQLETAWEEVRNPHGGPRARAADWGGSLTRGTMLAGSLLSAVIGCVLVVTPALTVAAVGALLGVHLTVQGVLQLLTVYRSEASKAVRRLLSAGGLAAVALGAALCHDGAHTVFVLGVWTGCGWLLRGLTMAISVTSDSVSHVFVYDDLLNAVIVSAGLFMTAFPFESSGRWPVSEAPY
ncbi:DUF308 domain-containing protein [Streptomyces sp. A0642]|uniref:DUF308 domain-containing protein n=1 Tax=Streptomyces sp. A0642 TaxID=2563100 RepID=UPI001F0DC1C8|nr:DUF308 domain-containing protein [Streptomyces sp. A0642]